MCGIVGYSGNQDPKEVILEGLRTLEYRGYDSAGIAILDHGQFKRVRAAGKLNVLSKKLKDQTFDGHVGIGHTRWATHGPPNERNAHPHVVEGISLVHNGIIENYLDLKDQLKKEGAVFESDTDSELVAHLISRENKTTKNLLQAVLNTIPKLHGAYAILVVSQQSPNEIIAFKNGPPLIAGQTDSAVIIASDLQAVVPYTKNVLYLEDGEILQVQGHQMTVFNIKGETLKRPLSKVNWDAEKVEKGGFDHFMLKEIFEQPRSVAKALAPHIDVENKTVKLNRVGFGEAFNDLEKLDFEKDWQKTKQVLQQTDRLFFVACGTSYYAALAGKYLIEQLAHLPVECDVASEFRYRSPVVDKKTLVVVISQSGETADTLAALRLAKEKGLKTLSICNVRRSTIDREAEGHLYMNSGAEVGVASTKAFSSTLAVLNVLALALAQVHGHGQDEAKNVMELLSVPIHMDTVLSYDKFFGEVANEFKKYKGFLYMGRGIHYPIALEGALKLKELAYIHAEGYAAGEMKHGPLALIDPNIAIVTLAPSDQLYEKTISNLEEAKARGGQLISIGTGSNERLRELSLHYLSLPNVPWFTMPLLEVVVVQLLAYHLAVSMGNDVDQPRNLAKSVTVE